MDSFIVILFSLFIGYSIRKSASFSAILPKKINTFIIYWALPAMILLEVPKLHFSTELMIPIVISWSVMIASALCVWLFSWYFKFSKAITGSLLLVSVLSNSTFLGIPIIYAYLGVNSLPFIMVYDQVGSFLALSTYGTFVVAYYGYKKHFSIFMVLKKIVTFPPFISFVIALFIQPTVFTLEVRSVLGVLASFIVPLALIAVGVQLQFRMPKSDIKPFIVSLMIKLLFAPFIAILVSSFLGWSGLAMQVSILEAGMAPMVTAGALASMMGLAPRLTSSIVGYGILFSFVTTGILYLYIS